MSTATLVSRLKELAGHAGRSIFERLGIVQQILADSDYVAEHFGDESSAMDTLESDCFGDLCGARSLAELLELKRAYPAEKQWEKHRWNLSRLLAEWDMARTKDKRGSDDERPVRVNKRMYEEVQEKLAETTAKLTIAAKERESDRSELERLRQRNVELEREVLVLNAKVEELQRLVDRRLSRVA